MPQSSNDSALLSLAADSGIASGVLARRGEVWFTNVPSLWKFTGHEKAETREELIRGFGVRFNYTGHDFHGLVFGPDGKRTYFWLGSYTGDPTRWKAEVGAAMRAVAKKR